VEIINFTKRKIRQILEGLTRLLGKNKVGSIVYEQIVKQSMQQVHTIIYQGLEMQFSVPNQLNYFRATTFATKEPETLEWIDGLPEECVLWDIGANVGLYTVYAALQRRCRVVAIEPSIFNLELLARNLHLNTIHEKVILLPLALSDEMGSNLLRMTSTDWGGALSTFGKNIGWDGQNIQEVFSFPTYGLSMDQAVEILGLPAPDFIKMDVDGIEHFLLQGGTHVLKKIQGILLEINDNFFEQAEISKELLERAGLKFFDKRHSEMFEESKFKNLYNQIWVRK